MNIKNLTDSIYKNAKVLAPKSLNDLKNLNAQMQKPLKKDSFKKSIKTNITKLAINKQKQLQGKKFKIALDIFKDMPNLNFKQGKLNDCYLLSALYAFAHNINAEAQKAIKSCISKDIHGNYFVNFKAWDIKVKVSPNELIPSIQAQGDKGIQVMEVAYGKLRQHDPANYWYRQPLEAVKWGQGGRPLGDLMDLPFTHITSFKDERIITDQTTFGKRLNDNKSFFEELKSEKPNPSNERILQMCEKTIKEMELKIKKVMSLLDNMSDDPGKYALTCATPPPDWKQLTVEGHDFYYKHNYAIKSVDKTAKTVTIINPHDTSKEIKLSYDGFLNAFSMITRVEIPDKKNNFGKALGGLKIDESIYD